MFGALPFGAVPFGAGPSVAGEAEAAVLDRAMRFSRTTRAIRSEDVPVLDITRQTRTLTLRTKSSGTITPGGDN